MLPSGLPEVVGDDEDLARFLTQSGHYSTIGVHHSAFLPSPKDQATSVSRHGPEPRAALQALGVAAAGSRPLYGAAILKAGAIRSIGLAVDASEPPQRHALISGWPWMLDDPREHKARQKDFAMQLARAAGAALLF